MIKLMTIDTLEDLQGNPIIEQFLLHFHFFSQYSCSFPFVDTNPNSHSNLLLFCPLAAQSHDTSIRLSLTSPIATHHKPKFLHHFLAFIC